MTWTEVACDCGADLVGDRHLWDCARAVALRLETTSARPEGRADKETSASPATASADDKEMSGRVSSLETALRGDK